MTAKKNETEAPMNEAEREAAGQECPETEAETAEEMSSESVQEESADGTQEEDASEAEKTAETAESPSEEDESMKDKYLRLMADFQNYKRRVEKEREDTRAYANEKIVTDLLTVLDNFDRAMQHEETDGFKEGMQMILDQFNTVLQHAGVAEIEAAGTEFDPNVHNAVMMEETDEVESNYVSAVLQKGYTLNGKVVRPSMVKVAK